MYRLDGQANPGMPVTIWCQPVQKPPERGLECAEGPDYGSYRDYGRPSRTLPGHRSGFFNTLGRYRNRESFRTQGVDRVIPLGPQAADRQRTGRRRQSQCGSDDGRQGRLGPNSRESRNPAALPEQQEVSVPLSREWQIDC